MSDYNLYGPIIDDDDLHEAIVRFLKKWLPGYIYEVCRRKGVPLTELPEFDYINAKSLDKWPEDQLPACVIFIPGLLNEPVREGDGAWSATWSVGIGVVVSSVDHHSTRKLLSAYMSAVRLALLQHESIDGFANSVTWRGDSYDEIPFMDEKTIQAGVITLGVSVNNVANSNSGRSTPPSDPIPDPGAFGLVETVDVDVRDKQA